MSAMRATGGYTETSTETTSGASGASENGCNTQKVEKHKTNNHGWKIATYTSKTRWCWDGDEILGVPVFRTSGKIYFWARLVWKYAGNHYKEEDMDYPDRWWHADRAMGHFKECIPVPGRLPITICLMSDFAPVINKWQYGNGNYRDDE